MSRILAISDIHGHLEGVELLLQEAQYEPQVDQLFFVGDYIDKDPKTWDTFDYIRDRVSEGAHAVMGNLEMWFLGQLQEGRRIAREQDLEEWLATLPLYASHEDFLFVHAGIRPHVPLGEQTRTDLLTIRNEFWENEHSLQQTIVFGHTPTHLMGAREGEIWCQSDRIGIDTGAKHHIRLTLVDLTNHVSYSCSTQKSKLYQDVRKLPW